MAQLDEIIGGLPRQSIESGLKVLNDCGCSISSGARWTQGARRENSQSPFRTSDDSCQAIILWAQDDVFNWCHVSWNVDCIRRCGCVVKFGFLVVLNVSANMCVYFGWTYRRAHMRVPPFLRNNRDWNGFAPTHRTAPKIWVPGLTVCPRHTGYVFLLVVCDCSFRGGTIAYKTRDERLATFG